MALHCLLSLLQYNAVLLCVVVWFGDHRACISLKEEKSARTLDVLGVNGYVEITVQCEEHAQTLGGGGVVCVRTCCHRASNASTPHHTTTHFVALHKAAQQVRVPTKARQRKPADKIGESQHVVKLSYSSLCSHQKERRHRNLPALYPYIKSYWYQVKKMK